MVVGYYDQKGIPDQVRSIIHFLPCFQMRVAGGEVLTCHRVEAGYTLERLPSEQVRLCDKGIVTKIITRLEPHESLDVWITWIW